MNVKIDYDKMVKPELETRVLKNEQEALTFKEYSIIQTHTVADVYVDNVNVVDEHRNAYIELKPIYDKLADHDKQLESIKNSIASINKDIAKIGSQIDTINEQIKDIYQKIGG